MIFFIHLRDKKFRVRTLFLHTIVKPIINFIMKQKSLQYVVVMVTLLSLNLTFAQRIITGNVSDESGVPLPGVNVIIKGTQTGTSRDFDGNYSINVSDSDVIEFSYVRSMEKEIEVANANSFDISLEMESDELEEIVLTGYGSVKKRDLRA